MIRRVGGNGGVVHTQEAVSLKQPGPTLSLRYLFVVIIGPAVGSLSCRMLPRSATKIFSTWSKSFRKGGRQQAAGRLNWDVGFCTPQEWCHRSSQVRSFLGPGTGLPEPHDVMRRATKIFLNKWNGGRQQDAGGGNLDVQRVIFSS